MLYRIGLLTALLTTTAAKAQLINDPAQATAARDTLLRQATQLRQQVQGQSAFFTMNGHTRRRRRQMMRGTAGTTPTLYWRQVTRYRRNGRVQEHFYIKTNSKLIMEEYRLNGRTLRLDVLSQVPGAGSTTPRHLGRYWQSGYLVLDRKQYILPRLAE